MIIEERLQLHRPIVAIEYLDNGQIAIVDSGVAVRIYELDPIKLIDGFKLSIPLNTSLGQSADVSRDGNYVAFAVEKKGATVYHAKKKRLLFHFSRHQGDVESIKIDPQSQYLATGGQDGKTFLWSLDTGQIVASLAHHADFVTAIDFSSNGLWVATGSYDRYVQISNVSFLSQNIKLGVHSCAITALRFIEKHRILAGDKNGNILVWDYFEKKVIKRLTKIFDEIVALEPTSDNNFLFAACKGGIVALFDLQKYELVASRYLKYTKPIRKLCFIADSNRLIVGFEDGEVQIVAPLKEEMTMKKFIENGEFGKAYQLATENPILYYTETFQGLESIWEEKLSQAIALLKEDRKKEAEKILTPFMKEGSKRLLIQSIFRDYSEYHRFKTAIEKEKYSLAYSLAFKFPMLKESPEFQKMEKIWKKRLEQIKKLILKKGGEDQIRELLKPFRGIAEKTTEIQEFLNKKEVYRLFMRLLLKQDYKTIYDLARHHPIVFEFDEYKKLKKIAESLIKKAKKALEEGHYAEVMQITDKLKEFPEYKEAAQKMSESANLYATAMRYFADKKYADIYRLLQNYPELEESQVVRNLEKVWMQAVRQAEQYAAKGDAAGLKKYMKSFLELKPKWYKIITLFKQAYIKQLEMIEGKDKERVRRGLQTYISHFGYDDLIAPLIQRMGIKEPSSEEKEEKSVDISTIDPRDLPEHIV